MLKKKLMIMYHCYNLELFLKAWQGYFHFYVQLFFKDFTDMNQDIVKFTTL